MNPAAAVEPGNLGVVAVVAEAADEGNVGIGGGYGEGAEGGEGGEVGPLEENLGKSSLEMIAYARLVLSCCERAQADQFVARLYPPRPKLMLIDQCMVVSNYFPSSLL